MRGLESCTLSEHSVTVVGFRCDRDSCGVCGVAVVLRALGAVGLWYAQWVGGCVQRLQWPPWPPCALGRVERPWNFWCGAAASRVSWQPYSHLAAPPF